jgi:hypothetical protein
MIEGEVIDPLFYLFAWHTFNCHDSSLLDRTSLSNHVIRLKREQNKGWVLWTNSRIMYEGSPELIKQLDWDIGYDTPDRAEKAGLIISKKWIDAGKPNL